MKAFLLNFALMSLLFLAGCKKADKQETTPIPQTPSTPVTVPAATISLNSIEQTIDGFGGSTAWSGALTDAQADAIFGNSSNSQMGLSLCRLRIDPGGVKKWASELSNAQKANARGASVFASPWSPPDTMKSNTNVVGGYLNTNQYANYANYLKSFGDYIKSGGVTLVAISIQNEPDANVNYESCSWDGYSMLTFVKNNAPAMGYPLMMPESESFNTGYSDPSLNDTLAVKHITYIAGHIYGTSPSKYTNAINNGKHVWMTEHYYNKDTITTCLTEAKEITDCMCSNMNAYVWWWMLPLNNSYCYLIDSYNNLTLQGCALAQFAKWVRPGFQRVDATYNPNTNIYVSAYKNGDKVVIVALNMGTSSFSEPFIIQNGSVSSVTPYVTSASQSIEALGSISVTDGSFTATLGAQSITTFVSN
jgi:glucuronoarabinoxylan endo-1,4-beta-xylanase